MGNGASRTRTRRLAIAALCVSAGIAATVGDATAQWWPWGKQDPPVPREPMRQPLPPIQPGQPDQPKYPQYPQPLPPSAAQPQPFGQRSASNICLQLEQRLVTE